jgi:hypothetical protein
MALRGVSGEREIHNGRKRDSDKQRDGIDSC